METRRQGKGVLYVSTEVELQADRCCRVGIIRSATRGGLEGECVSVCIRACVCACECVCVCACVFGKSWRAKIFGQGSRNIRKKQLNFSE